MYPGAHVERTKRPALDLIHPRSLAALSGQLQRLVRGRLWLQVLVAMALGIGTGILLGPSSGLVGPRLATTLGNWLALPGHLFLALVQMIVVPLVFASVIRGLAATEDLEQLKRLGIRVVLFFVGMTAVGILIGIGLGVLIEPGRFVDSTKLLASLPEAALEPPGGVAPPPEGSPTCPRRSSRCCPTTRCRRRSAARCCRWSCSP